jgi:hypothetical protein
MNTNNRIVWLQQQVVLLNVMERAEDLIKKILAVSRILLDMQYVYLAIHHSSIADYSDIRQWHLAVYAIEGSL